jgi:ornithine carbamoyltransferase
MYGKSLVSIADLTPASLTKIIDVALALKRGQEGPDLRGKTLALLFEKPSLRTRVSFEVAMRQLGGDSLYLSPQEVGLGGRESVADVARVLSRYVQVIAARTFSHQTVEELAHYSSVPVVNALSDAEHPCQALADLLTIYEKKSRLQGVTLAFIGDGNNVAASLALAAAMYGINFRIASPAGYELPPSIREKAQTFVQANRAEVAFLRSPQDAATGADVLYTDVWASMGQEAEGEQRRRDFVGYQVNNELLRLAAPGALVMHDMPVHRGEEITNEVMEGPRSVVFDQAENRLHAQKAVLSLVLAE